MSKVRRRASFANQTPIPWTKTEPPNAHHVRPVVMPWKKEVLRAAIVWPGNLKKPQPVAKRFVPNVHRAITRTRQTCQRASNAHLVMPNLLQNKRHALNAAPVNSTMLQVLLFAKCVSIRRTLVAKEETVVAPIAPSVGRRKTAVPNVSRAARVRLALGV